MWIFSSLEVFYIVHSKHRDVPWNILNILKLLITSLLIILSITDFATAVKLKVNDDPGVYSVDVYSPVIKILSFVSKLFIFM